MTHDAWGPLHGQFRWRVPARFNIAQVCCARWAASQPQAVALRAEREDGRVTLHRFGELQRAANQLSNALTRLGVQRGDRVAVVMPQRFETAVAHMAIYQMGAVAMPLSQLFGPDALEYRLNDSEAVLAIVDESAIANVRAARANSPGLKVVLAVGDAVGQGDLDWEAALQRERAQFTAVSTKADEAAVLIYTSGTTGPPKGALMPHRALIGNLSGFVCSQNLLRSGTLLPAKSKLGPGGEPADAVFWSPADWAWTGGLMDALLPSLYFAMPIVAFQGRFGPERAFALMQGHRVTNSLIFVTIVCNGAIRSFH